MATNLHMNMLNADDRTKKYSLPFKGGVFRLSTVKWPNWYLYMESNKEGNVRGCSGLPPGNQGEFIFTPLGENNLYLITSKNWPTWHLYMEDDSTGNVRGREGDPGKQGHWRVKPRYDGSFMLSTAKWDHWHMYMQDNGTGNVRGYGGDPGSQAYFILSCAVRLSLEDSASAGSVGLNNTI